MAGGGGSVLCHEGREVSCAGAVGAVELYYLSGELRGRKVGACGWDRSGEVSGLRFGNSSDLAGHPNRRRFRLGVQPYALPAYLREGSQKAPEAERLWRI